jgi:protein SCO1
VAAASSPDCNPGCPRRHRTRGNSRPLKVGREGRLLLLAACLIFAIGAATSARADGTTPDALLNNARFDQQLDAQVPLGLPFRDETGQTVALGSYFTTGKPVILVLSYYRCPNLCTLVLTGLASSLRGVPFDIGNQFQIVTVSIDPTDNAVSALAKKATVLANYTRPGAAAGWHFLTGDEPAIRPLADAVGFRYAYDAKLQQYAHPAGIMVLTPTGKIAQYFYGIQFPSRDLRLGLVDASAGKIGSPVDQVLLRCYHYDPVTGQYDVAIMTLLRGGAVSAVIGLALVVFMLHWHDRRTRRAAMARAAPPLPEEARP